MNNTKNIKIVLGISYLLIISIFFWFFFQNFSIEDFTSYEFIKKNFNEFSSIKNKNLFLVSFLFFIFTVIWVLLLGFGTPIFLIGGFIFGKWLGTLLTVLSLSIGATLLYIFANFYLKEFIKKKFSKKFNFLSNKFKKNEFIFFVIYRFIGGIPFFISNILPTLFNVKVKIFFFGSIIGMLPQLFIGTTLGSGIGKIIENNEEPPSIYEIILMPDIYIPIIGIFVLFFIGFYFKKSFFK
tara:strand:+ start:1501 stop:2217 length:717 start_codon:yes stop_codon:yes gene_type:complete